jgi:hypothetical protein
MYDAGLNDQLLGGVIQVVITASIAGGVGLFWWLIQYKIKKVDKAGHVVRKQECDETFGEVKEMFQDLREHQAKNFDRVHERVDETQQMLIDHVQSELNRNA